VTKMTSGSSFFFSRAQRRFVSVACWPRRARQPFRCASHASVSAPPAAAPPLPWRSSRLFRLPWSG
jgi:hypothetical protein